MFHAFRTTARLALSRSTSLEAQNARIAMKDEAIVIASDIAKAGLVAGGVVATFILGYAGAATGNALNVTPAPEAAAPARAPRP